MRETARAAARLLALAVAWMSIHFLAGRLTGSREPAAALGWTGLSCLLAVGALYALAAASTLTGAARAAALFSLLYVVMYFNSAVEALFFSLLPSGRALARLLAQSAAVSAVLALGVHALVPPAPAGTGAPAARRSPIGWAIRIGAMATAYAVLYFVAGMLAYPHVRGFYEGRPLPQPGRIFLVQLFRGALLVAAMLPFLRTARIPRGRMALLAGVGYALLGGVAPLLLPNPLLPLHVRWVHGLEIGATNLVFGLLVGRALGIHRHRS